MRNSTTIPERTNKLLSVLDLFDSESTKWGADEISKTLGYSRSSAYRYLADLCDHGLLAQGAGKTFVLGPKIFTLEYLLRNTDPLILSGRPIIEALVDEFGGTALVNRLFRDRFLCVDYESTLSDAESRYRKGQPLPLVRGANARVIQAHLPRHRLLRIYEGSPLEFRKMGMGASFSELQASLKEVRAAGVFAADSEFREGFIGVAAPILDPSGVVIGSLSFVGRRDILSDEHLQAVKGQLKFSARILSRQMPKHEK